MSIDNYAMNKRYIYRIRMLNWTSYIILTNKAH